MMGGDALFIKQAKKDYSYKNKDWLLHKMYQEGLSIRNIAKQCDVAFSTIYRNIKKFNITLSPNEYQIFCISCNLAKKHFAKGMCRPCYSHKSYVEKRDYWLNKFREYRKRNREKMNAQQCEKYTKNKEIYNTRTAEWKRNNKEKVNAINKKWRQTKMGRLFYRINRIRRRTNLDVKEIKLVIESNFIKRNQNFCEACGKSTEDLYHIDHIIPIVLGGTNCYENLQILCPNCNRRKARKIIDYRDSLNKNQAGRQDDGFAAYVANNINPCTGHINSPENN